MKKREYAALAADLLDASLEKLTSLALAGLPDSLEAYRRVLFAFLSGDTAALEVETEKVRNEPDFPFLVEFTTFRRDYLRESLSEKRVEEFSASAAAGHELWAGEHFMLLAAAEEQRARTAQAQRLYERAAAAYAAMGARGKALRAQFNSVTLLGHLDPKKTLIQENFFLYREAKRLHQPIVMAPALQNISREYQKMGALRMALKYATMAVAASAEDIRGHLYFLAVVHRAHVLHDLGRHAEAEMDLEEARTSAFPSVKAACAALDSLVQGRATAAPSLTRSWQERVAEFAKKSRRVTLSDHEERLLQFVSAEPRTKFELVSHLFGDRLDPFAAENRLKNLVYRIRQKLPGLLLLENERYFLADRGSGGKRKSG